MSEIESRANLVGQPRRALEAFISDLGEQPFRARQIMQWIYQRDIRSFDEMTDLSKDLRSTLRTNATIDIPAPVDHRTSADGTSKHLFRFAAQAHAESVLIPDGDRATLCISSQAGCALACTFCQTGRMGAGRNLTRDEIIGQILAVPARRLSNLVFMGMGEPLLNLDELLAAIDVITDELGIGMAPRRITVSTAGIAPGIHRLADSGSAVGLAVSLNAPTDELRDELMPINRRYPIHTLLEAARAYADRCGSRRAVTFEYVLLAGVNDAIEQADALGRLLAPLGSKVNLIPHNPIEGSPYTAPSETTTQRFQDRVKRRVKTVTMRWHRGRDVCGACGQLGAAHAE